jgi:hypothetical protein
MRIPFSPQHPEVSSYFKLLLQVTFKEPTEWSHMCCQHGVTTVEGPSPMWPNATFALYCNNVYRDASHLQLLLVEARLVDHASVS